MKKIMTAFVVALALGLVGCHHDPAYVGTYKVKITPELTEMANKVAAAMGQKDGAQKMLDDMSKGSIKITADGKFTMVDESKGTSEDATYKVDGNKITVTNPKGGQPMECTFDPKDSTLTMEGGGMKMVFQKQ